MHLERTTEQRLLFETAARFFRAHTTDAPWRTMGELGLISAAVVEERGGLGGKAADIAPICEAIGGTGAHVPYFSSVLLPAALLCDGYGSACAPDLQALMAGESRIAVAHSEQALVFSDEEPATHVDASHSRIEGRKHRVWDASHADTLIVSARGPDGFSWYRMDARGRGVDVRPVHDMDGMSSATVVLSGAECSEICSGERALQALDRAIKLAIVGVLAESVGIMARLFDATREWLSGRKQFARALWSNQVLRHRAVDMFIALEEARSMLALAIYTCDSAREREMPPALHAAKVHIANCARFVGQQAVHLHGAMGLTEELGVGPSYRRLEALNAVFGGADHHTWAYAARGERAV